MVEPEGLQTKIVIYFQADTANILLTPAKVRHDGKNQNILSAPQPVI
jgi:hypothetical protein